MPSNYLFVKKNISKWEYTLKYITEILDSNNIKYYISASGLRFIKGKDIYPYDIDLFMSKDNVEKVYELLKQYAVSNLHYWKEDDREYLEFQGTYNNIPFEILEWNNEENKLKKIKFKDMYISILD